MGGRAAFGSDGCAPARWRDDWLVVPRPGGDVPVIGAVAATIEEWREHIAAGRGISLCPASSEAFSARPGIVFVPSRGVPVTSLCVAWRADDVRPEVLAFVKVATGVAPARVAAGGGAEAAWRTLRGRTAARVGRDGASRSSWPALVRAGQHLSRMVPQLAGVTAACTARAARSEWLAAPGSAQSKRTSETEPNVSAPRVRSSSTS